MSDEGANHELARLERELKHYRALAENTPDWLWETNAAGEYTWVGPRIIAFLGFRPDEVVGKTPLDLMAPREARRLGAFFQRLHVAHEPFEALVNVNLHKDGSEVIFETSGVPIFDAAGHFRGYRGIDRDISLRVKSERTMRLAETVVRNAAEGIVLADVQGRITTANPAFVSLTGHPLDEVVGQPPHMLRCPGADARGGLWALLGDAPRWTGEGTCRHRSGEDFPVWVALSTVEDTSPGQVSGYVALVSDMTERRAAEATIRFQATHDMLTQLANRGAFLSALRRVVSTPGAEAAVFFIDLDGFKPVNDTHGHGVGDVLLQAVARRLERCVRDSDLVARFGGDEFTVLLRAPVGGEVPRRAARAITQAIAEPYSVDGLELRVTASIGVALVPAHGRTLDEVVSAADRAMYRAKRRGGDCVHFAQTKQRRASH